LSYSKIFTFVYKPFHYGTDKKYFLNEEIDPNGFYYGTYEGSVSLNHDFHISNDAIISNRYYTLIDVILKDSIGEVVDNMKDVIKDNESEFYKSIKNIKAESDFWKSSSDKIVVCSESFEKLDTRQIFILRSENNGDTVLCSETSIRRFILVPYFVKQKKVLEGKTFLCFDGVNSKSIENIDVKTGEFIEIPILSKWKSRVDLLDIDYEGKKLRGDEYKVWLILENDKGQILLKNPNKISNFIEENEYVKQKAEKKMQQAQIDAKQKEAEKRRIENEKQAYESFKKKCITKYGTVDGEMIAQNKVKIGMTKEMCKDAWGSPFWTDKTTTELHVLESWYFGFGYSLHFENNKLIIIDE